MKFEVLPTEILSFACDFLTIQDLAQVFRISKAFNRACKDDAIWNKFGSQSFKAFVKRVHAFSHCKFQAFCMQVPSRMASATGSQVFVAVCPFTKLFAYSDTEENAVQQLFDLFKLVQLVPDNFDTEELLQLYDANMGPVRGKIQEAVFVDAAEQFTSTFMIYYPLLYCNPAKIHSPQLQSQKQILQQSQKHISQGGTIHAVNLKVTQDNVLYVSSNEHSDISKVERDLILKSMESIARGEQFVCWEKCGAGMVRCTELFCMQERARYNQLNVAKLHGNTQIWVDLEESKSKRYAYWFSTSC